MAPTNLKIGAKIFYYLGRQLHRAAPWHGDGMQRGGAALMRLMVFNVCRSQIWPSYPKTPFDPGNPMPTKTEWNTNL